MEASATYGTTWPMCPSMPDGHPTRSGTPRLGHPVRRRRPRAALTLTTRCAIELRPAGMAGGRSPGRVGVGAGVENPLANQQHLTHRMR